MSKVIIRWARPCALHVKEERKGRIVFAPGNNEIDYDLWVSIRKNNGIQKRLDKGLLTEVENSGSASPVRVEGAPVAPPQVDAGTPVALPQADAGAPVAPSQADAGAPVALPQADAGAPVALPQADAGAPVALPQADAGAPVAPPQADVSALLSVDETEALTMIAQCTDLNKLRIWASTEKRNTVMQTLFVRYNELGGTK